MKLSKTLKAQIESQYRPGMGVEELGVAAGCRRFEAHLFLGERLFVDAVVEMRGQRLSLREIARRLGVDHTAVHRAVQGAGQDETAPPTDETPPPEAVSPATDQVAEAVP